MKKLKIISLCFLISLLFIPKAFADSTLYNNEFKYDEEVVTIVNQYSNEISLIKDYIVDNGIGSYNLNNGNYLIDYDVTGFTNNNIGVGLCSIADGTRFQSWWASNQYGTNNNAGLPGLTCYSQNFTINNGVVSTTSSAQLGSGSPATRGCMTCNPNEEDCICNVYHDYFDTSDLIDSQYININSRSCNGISGTCKYVPVVFSNFDNEVKVVGENISTKMLFDNLQIFVNPYKCNIDPNGFRTGVLQNVSDVSFRVRGSNVVSEYPLEGSFALQNTSFTATDSFDFVTYIDLDIIKGDESDNTYNVSGTKRWDNSTKTFTIDYKITPLTDNATIFDVIFKISPNSNLLDDFFQKGSINVFDCQPLNVYVDNTYGYTDNNTGATVSTDTGLMNILNNSNSPDLGFFNNLNTLLPPGPIDSILNIPMVMFTSISNFLSNDCQPLNITLPWVNQQVQLKCIRSFYSDINATTFIEGVGSVASVIILVQYFIGLYNWFDDHIQLTHKKVRAWGGD